MIKLAVIGHPVAHSLSPKIHGIWLKENDIEGGYDAIDVAPEDLGKFIKNNVLDGFNVTVPHKEKIISLLDEVDETAKAIGAVNTVIRKGNKLFGTNTDAFGFAENLRKECAKFSHELRMGHALVLGAGGAARAVVFALKEMGFKKVVIANRTLARAEALAAEFGCEAVAWDEIDVKGVDLLVNTTTLGMDGQPKLEIDLSDLSVDAVVADIVYKPLETELLAAARARGNVTVEGLGMLVWQAARAFEMWCNVEVDGCDI